MKSNILLDNAIHAFLLERKTAKMKSFGGKLPDEGGIEACFAPENWIPDAAKRAGQLSLVSHPSKFTHPSAKTSSIIFKRQWSADGFLRSGNVETELDVFGNAAALDVYKFLSLTLKDGKTILAHLEANTPVIQAQLGVLSTPFEELRANFLAIEKDKFPHVRTSSQVKQVYFPVENDYHLLSILTPSGLVFGLKDRLQTLRFSEETKLAREAEKHNTFHLQGFDELNDLVVIGFGGTKPQNISVLNNKFHGESYLLSCLPPKLTQRTAVPLVNFFKNSIHLTSYKEGFSVLHGAIQQGETPFSLRDELCVVDCIVDTIIGRVWHLRALDEGWSQKTALPHYQKIWLDDGFLQERMKRENWLPWVIEDFLMWFLEGYKKTLAKEAGELGDGIVSAIKKRIEEHQEGLL